MVAEPSVKLDLKGDLVAAEAARAQVHPADLFAAKHIRRVDDLGQTTAGIGIDALDRRAIVADAFERHVGGVDRDVPKTLEIPDAAWDGGIDVRDHVDRHGACGARVQA